MFLKLPGENVNSASLKLSCLKLIAHTPLTTRQQSYKAECLLKLRRAVSTFRLTSA